MASGVSDPLYGVWGSSATDALVAGSAGVYHFDGTVWSLMDTGGNGGGYGVWGSSGSDVFVVGSSGRILHYDGTSWSPMVSGTSEALSGVWGAAAPPMCSPSAGAAQFCTTTGLTGV